MHYVYYGSTGNFDWIYYGSNFEEERDLHLFVVLSATNSSSMM